MATKEYEVFIAFSPVDGSESAAGIEKGLLNLGVKVFVEHVGPGAKQRSHETEAANSEVMVMVLTRGYVDSLMTPKTAVHRDLVAALAARSCVVPVVCYTLEHEEEDVMERLPPEMRAVFDDLTQRAVKGTVTDARFIQSLIEHCRPPPSPSESLASISSMSSSWANASLTPSHAASLGAHLPPGEPLSVQNSQLDDLVMKHVADHIEGISLADHKPSLAALLTLAAPKTPPPKPKKKIIGVEPKPRLLKGHGESVLCLKWSPDSFILASGSDDKTVRIWDPSSGNLKHVYAGHTGRVLRLCFIGSGTILFSASKDRNICVWDMIRLIQRGVMEGHKNVVWGLDVSQDGTRLLSCSHDETLRTWEVMKMAQVTSVKGGHTSTIYCVAISPNQHYFATAAADKTVKIWDFATFKELKTLVGHTSHVTQIAWVPDSFPERICSCSWDETVKMWDVSSGTVMHTFTGHSSKVNCVSVSPDGGTIVSGSDDMTVKLFRIATGECFSTLDGHGGEVMDVAVSPDGAYIASACADSIIRVWKIISI